MKINANLLINLLKFFGREGAWIDDTRKDGTYVIVDGAFNLVQVAAALNKQRNGEPDKGTR